jgi:hypothetical protein
VTAPVASRLILVEWLDSSQPSSGWGWLRTTDRYDIVPHRSVGWLVEQPNPDLLVLAPTLSQPDEDGDRQTIGLLRIPACAITGRWEIVDPAAGWIPPDPDSLKYPETKVG